MRSLFVVLWLVFTVGAAAWTYADAGGRRQSGCLWSAVVLLLSLPGLLLYLALRPVLDAVDSYGERLWELERRHPPR